MLSANLTDAAQLKDEPNPPLPLAPQLLRLFVLGVIVLAAAEAEFDGAESVVARAAQQALSRGRSGAGGAAAVSCEHPRAFAEGEWKMPTAAEAAAEGAAPPCCAWDLGTPNAPSCAGSVSGAEGALGALGVLSGPRYYYSQTGGNACQCPPSVERDALRWSARGACGALPPFDARRFCRLLRGRRLLFVGDSTSDQAATSLINTVRAAFGAPVRRPAAATSGEGGTGGGGNEPAAIGCGESIFFASSDTLTLEKFGRYNRGRRWLDYAHALDHERDIMVISGGPHIYSSPALRRVIEQVVAEHAAAAPFLRLVWRSAWPGGCSAAPLAAPPDGEFWEAYVRSGRPIYTYAEHAEWDEIALPFFWQGASGSANDTGVARRAFLDISPLLQRPDAHVDGGLSNAKPDCLHLCLPGPLHPFLGQALLRVLEGMGLDDGE